MEIRIKLVMIWILISFIKHKKCASITFQIDKSQLFIDQYRSEYKMNSFKYTFNGHFAHNLLNSSVSILML